MKVLIVNNIIHIYIFWCNRKYNIDGLNFDTYYADESRIGADGRQKFIALIKVSFTRCF